MRKVVLIPGDGIGREISESVQTVLQKAGAEIEWIEATAGLQSYEQTGEPLPDETIDLIREHGLLLKGPLTTPVGSGFRSVNVTLRQTFDLYSNIRPARSLPGIHTPFNDVDLVLFRENTQGMYIGQERYVKDNPNHAETIAVVTRYASDRIIRSAFDYARKHERKKVTLVHKANILKYTTGLFLKVGEEVAKEYPDIEFDDMIVDNAAMQMAMRPSQFDLIVTTNLFGDILSDLASGLVGGLGITGSANIGDEHAMFEAVHGSAPDIVGQKKANPMALLQSACMMLQHIDQYECASNISEAIFRVLPNKDVCTPDIGGKGSTKSFTKAICDELR